MGLVGSIAAISSLTVSLSCRSIGPVGPRLVRGYTSTRFGSRAQGEPFTDTERELFTEYMYHTIAARGSGELALKHIFQLGAYARKPLLDRWVKRLHGNVSMERRLVTVGWSSSILMGLPFCEDFALAGGVYKGASGQVGEGISSHPGGSLLMSEKTVGVKICFLRERTYNSSEKTVVA